MFTVLIDNGAFEHKCESLAAAVLLVDGARRAGREAVIDGYLY